MANTRTADFSASAKRLFHGLDERLAAWSVGDTRAANVPLEMATVDEIRDGQLERCVAAAPGQHLFGLELGDVRVGYDQVPESQCRKERFRETPRVENTPIPIEALPRRNGAPMGMALSVVVVLEDKRFRAGRAL